MSNDLYRLAHLAWMLPIRLPNYSAKCGSTEQTRLAASTTP
jgi:hypothetical protein